MSEAKPKEILTLSLSPNVFRDLASHASETGLDLSVVIEAALEAYLAVVERCEPDVRELVRTLVSVPVEYT